MNAGARILVCGEVVRLEIGTESDAARRELRAVAWSVLEVLALMGCEVDGRWVATTNARDLASRLGIRNDRVVAFATFAALRAISSPAVSRSPRPPNRAQFVTL